MKLTRQPLRRYEYPLLALGIALAMIHIIDFAFVHPGPSATADFGLASVISVLLLMAYQWLSLTWRALVAVLIGTYVAVQGLFGHVLHVLTGTASGADYSGVFYLAGGTAMLCLGTVLARRILAHQANG